MLFRDLVLHGFRFRIVEHENDFKAKGVNGKNREFTTCLFFIGKAGIRTGEKGSALSLS